MALPVASSNSVWSQLTQKERDIFLNSIPVESGKLGKYALVTAPSEILKKNRGEKIRNLLKSQIENFREIDSSSMMGMKKVHLF